MMSARVAERLSPQDLFTKYNRRYFADHLPPDCPVKVTGAKRYLHPEALGLLDLKTGITIRPGPAELMRRTLLHEMAHLAVMMAAIGRGGPTLTEREALSATRAGDPADVHAHGIDWQREMWRLALNHGETWAVQHIVDNNPSVIDVLVAAFTRLPASSLPAPTNDEEVYRRLIENRDRRDGLRAAYLSARPAIAGGHSARSAKSVGRLAAPADALR